MKWRRRRASCQNIQLWIKKPALHALHAVPLHLKIFDYNDEGVAFVILDENEGTAEVPEGFFDDLDDAVEGCPTESIKVETSPFKVLVD